MGLVKICEELSVCSEMVMWHIGDILANDGPHTWSWFYIIMPSDIVAILVCVIISSLNDEIA